MKGLQTLACAAVLVGIGFVSDAQAQRTPAAGMAAIGGDVGVFIPDDEFDTAPTLSGFFEYYVTPRVSLRPTFGWADPSFEREEVDSLRQMRLTFNVQYNWERGGWHPFVGAGIGAYFLQEKDNEREFGPSHTKAGVNFGGGLEYFTSRTLAVKGEGLFHVVSDDNIPWDPSGFSLTIGLKKYF
ncbi:MAG: outer membrane beta-barrel protein [Acidobacteria bacterium]|nr:outer membrane beta-barrel protein [Acidobacteriota bacterium]